MESSFVGRFGNPAGYCRFLNKTQAKIVNKNYIHDILIEVRSDTWKLMLFTGVGRTPTQLFFPKRLVLSVTGFKHLEWSSASENERNKNTLSDKMEFLSPVKRLKKFLKFQNWTMYVS